MKKLVAFFSRHRRLAAAVIFLCFAVLGGWLILKERMKPLELAGCALVFCAVILAQLPVPQKHRE